MCTQEGSIHVCVWKSDLLLLSLLGRLSFESLLFSLLLLLLLLGLKILEVLPVFNIPLDETPRIFLSHLILLVDLFLQLFPLLLPFLQLFNFFEVWRLWDGPCNLESTIELAIALVHNFTDAA